MLYVSHVTQNRKDDKAGEEAGQTVDGAGEHSVPVAIVVEFVVTRQSQQRSKPGPKRKENLRGRVYPDLGIIKFVPFWSEVVTDTISSTR